MNIFFVGIRSRRKGQRGLLLFPLILFFAGKLLVYVPKLRFSSKYSEQLRSPQKLKFSGTPYFLRVPTYSSVVLVEMVVVVLRESADWMQVAVVVTVRQALQDVTPMVRAIRRNAMMIKFFFMIQTLLLLTIYGRTDL